MLRNRLTINDIMSKLKNPAVWFHGLASAFIGGGMAAVSAGLAANAIAPGQFDVQYNLANMLKLMFAVFAISGITSASAYLKQSPLPPIEIDDKPASPLPLPMGLLLASCLLLTAGCQTLFDTTVTIKDVGEVIRKEYVALYDAGAITPENHAQAERAWANYQLAMRTLRIALEASVTAGETPDTVDKLRAAKGAIQPLLDLITPLLARQRSDTLTRNLNAATP